MAFVIDLDTAQSNTGGRVAEKHFIPKGLHAMRFAKFIECGHHQPMFNGAPATYDKGPNKGQVRPPVFRFRMVFESLCEHSNPEPLTVGESMYDDVEVPAYVWDNPAKASAKMNITKIFKRIASVHPEIPTNMGFAPYLGKIFGVPVTNKPNTRSSVEGMQFANPKFTEIDKPIVTAGTMVIDMTEDAQKHDWMIDPVYFDWEDPDPEVFKGLGILLRYELYQATDFKSSPLFLMICENEELTKMMKDDIERLTKKKKEPTEEPAKEEAAAPEDAEAKAQDAAAEEAVTGLGGAAAALLQQQGGADA